MSELPVVSSTRELSIGELFRVMLRGKVVEAAIVLKATWAEFEPYWDRPLRIDSEDTRRYYFYRALPIREILA